MTKKTTFSYRSALAYTFEKIATQWPPLLFIGLCWFILDIASIELISRYTGVPAHMATQPIGTFLALPTMQMHWLAMFYRGVLGFYFYFIVIRFSMALYKNERLSIPQIFSVDITTMLRFIGTLLIVGIMIGFGFLFFLIPGIYLWTKYYFAGYTIIDDPKNTISVDLNLNPLLTKNQQLKLFLVFLVGILVYGITVLLTSFYAPPPLIPYIGWQTLYSIAFAIMNVHIYHQLKPTLEHQEPNKEAKSTPE